MMSEYVCISGQIEETSGMGLRSHRDWLFAFGSGSIGSAFLNPSLRHIQYVFK
jgi:hypothetical protein